MASLPTRWRATASRCLAPTRLAALPTWQPLSGTTRGYAMPSRTKVTRELERATRQIGGTKDRSPSMLNMQKMANDEYFRDGGGPLFPGTFVSLPLSQYPRSPRSFAQYHWARIKNWFVGAVSVLNYKLKSMPNWTTRPRWKARRGRIGPAAKAMHREMLEAFAAGDKPTLRRLCLGEFANKLCAAIDRRDARQSVRFALLRYNGRLLYPRLLSHQIHQVNPFDAAHMTEQAVVAISSTQQASRVDVATGETVPGSLRMQDKVEYVVLSRQVNTRTFVESPWRLWGTTSPTTLEAYLREKAFLEREQARRSGWDASATKQ
ncbi:hypothetical protein E4U42_007093 [Claviceps africana]|uniref:Large ribosomal subunit protein mL45 n=1 Tax=Claviceps africana TaxID=83212 RepID=A0A8K0NGC1_9HYPO|nr:hypothetical protein E4U42_007093 [Claviceps africana]